MLQHLLYITSASSMQLMATHATNVDKAPCLSIRIVILILPSDTLFGDDLYCICFDHPRETAMLSNRMAHVNIKCNVKL